MKPQPPVTKMRIAPRTSSGRKGARADFSAGPPDAAQAVLYAREGEWILWLILGLAAALRILPLEKKPPHFDEGINGWFVDQMVKEGFYRYDPTNYHGPLHFYILFLSQTLFGRNLYALRVPVVLASLGAVWLALKYDRVIPRPLARIAALAMALSPGLIFYGRYSIHERSEEHTSELQSQSNLVCRLLLEKKNTPSHDILTYHIHSASFISSPPRRSLRRSLRLPGARPPNTPRLLRLTPVGVRLSLNVVCY